ncbi:MAG TPA: PAS domain-containing protein [Bradyrhizobium sp.]|nr:PAS domain-containing protein [Bradyrhizobium sp.]
MNHEQDQAIEGYPRTKDVNGMRARAVPLVIQLYDYWDGKRHGRSMPSRSDIDPTEMGPWLDGIQLVDVFHNPRRLVYRLVGDGQVRSRGRNPTGRTVEECFIGVSREDVLRSFEIAIQDRCMVYDWGRYPSGEGFTRGQETIFLPLSTNGADVDKILTFTIDQVGR